MKKSSMNKLRNTIVAKQFVNCYSKDFSRENRKALDQFISNFMEGYKKIFIDVDIQVFQECANEGQEAKILLELINSELSGQGIGTFEDKAISIANILLKWGKGLDRRTLLVFHFFHDQYHEKEKNILRSIRKTIRNRDEISRYLGILLVSNRKVSKWELMPESNLDDRHVAFFELEAD